MRAEWHEVGPTMAELHEMEMEADDIDGPDPDDLIPEYQRQRLAAAVQEDRCARCGDTKRLSGNGNRHVGWFCEDCALAVHYEEQKGQR